MKLWEVEQSFAHGLGPILTISKTTTSHSTIKNPLVLLENDEKKFLFNIPKLHFEKGSKTQSF